MTLGQCAIYLLLQFLIEPLVHGLQYRRTGKARIPRHHAKTIKQDNLVFPCHVFRLACKARPARLLGHAQALLHVARLNLAAKSSVQLLVVLLLKEPFKFLYQIKGIHVSFRNVILVGFCKAS